MKTGMILDDGNCTVLERENEHIDREVNGIVDEETCVYGRKYAYWKEEIIGTGQKFLGYHLYRGLICHGLIEDTEELERFPNYIDM
jgi:hypothetical protein